MSPEVCLGYLTANDQPLLDLSLATMLACSWIKRVVVLDTTQQIAPQDDGRTLRLGRHYGYGFDRAPEAGGFDEIAARNDLLALLREQDCQWLLLCDTDEFFLPETHVWIEQAERAGKQALLLECWHACSPTRHVVRSQLTPAGLRNDPHIRAVHRDLACRYTENRHCRQANRTQHCGFNVAWSQALAPLTQCHIHVRHLLRTPPEPHELIAPLPLPLAWPIAYRTAGR